MANPGTTATTIRSDRTRIFMEVEEDDWLQLADVAGVTPPGFETELEDVTHLDTPDGEREFLEGRAAPQTVGVSIRWAPGSPTITALYAARGKKMRFRIDYPNGKRSSFSAIVQAWAPAEASGGALTGTLTLQISGAVTHGDVT